MKQYKPQTRAEWERNEKLFAVLVTISVLVCIALVLTTWGQ